MISLGIDPGLVATGLAAIKGTAVVYRGSIRTRGDDSDNDRSDFIVEKLLGVLHEVRPLAITIEGYEYQGPRTHSPNAIRIAMLVGRIYQTAKFWANDDLTARSVEIVYRTTWGHALGITTDASQERRLSRLTGLTLKNAHERDAASIAEYGQRLYAAGIGMTG